MAYNMDAMGPTIGELRKKCGMTQKELADHVGVTVQAVSKWESGLNYPDITFLPAISEALNVPIERLLGQDTETVSVQPGTEIIPTEAEVREEAEDDTENADSGFYFGKPEDGEDTPELRAYLDEVLENAMHSADDAVKTAKEKVKTALKVVNETPFEQTHGSMTGIRRGWDFDAAQSVSVNIKGDAQAVIHRSDDGKCHVEARGDKGFLDGLTVAYTGNTLQIQSRNIRLDDSDECLIEIWPGVEHGNRAELAVSVEGNIQCEPDFDTVIAMVTADGSITCHNAEFCQAMVSGDGEVKFGAVKDVDISTSGAGDVHGQSVIGKAKIRCSGAGDVYLDETQLCDLIVQIVGAGEVHTGELAAERAVIAITGAGELFIEGGETQNLNVSISGAGEVNAEELDVENACIRMSGAAEIHLHSVRGVLDSQGDISSELIIEEK